MTGRLAVLGGGVAGLSAAIHARLLDWEVDLYEANAVGGKAAEVQIDGYRLDPGPSIIILPEIYAELFARANRAIDDYLHFQRLDPITTAYYRGERIGIPAGVEPAADLIRTLDADDADSFIDLMERLESIAPRVQRTIFEGSIDKPWELLKPDLVRTALKLWPGQPYKAVIDRLFEHPLLKAFFYGFPSYSGGTYNRPNIGGLMIPYYMFAGGVYAPIGGVRAIPQALTRLAEEIGVVIHRNARIESLQTAEKRVIGAELKGGQSIVADAFISAVDRYTVASWLGKPETRAPSYSYFTVHYGVRRPLPQIDYHTLVVPQDFEFGFDALYNRKSFPTPPIVYFNNPTTHDPVTAPPGRTSLFAVVTTPALEQGMDWELWERSGRDLVEAALAKAGVELAPEEIDFVRIQSPRYFEREHGNYRGSLYGLAEEVRPFNGMLPAPNRDERYRNLAYAGGSVQPGAGLPMAVLSGRFAAEELS